MKIRNNILLLFSKLPETGLVKTRLTAERGGMFLAEDAMLLYRAMLLDVCDVCLEAFKRLAGAEDAEGMSAERELGASAGDEHPYGAPPEDDMADSYKLVISVAPASNREAMRELIFGEFGSDAPISFIADAGASFDEHYNDAFAQCWEAGADCILSMGADMPALTVDDVVRGFDALHGLQDAGKQGIVLSPDQEMGVSIIGWTRDTDFDHTAVFYNPTGLTVLPAYIEKAAEAALPAIYLPPVPDVDTMADLMHNITLVNALEYCCQFDGGVAPMRTLEVLRDLGCDEVRIPPNDLMDPRDVIDS